LVSQKTFLIIPDAFQIFATSTYVSPHPLKGSTVLKFDIPLQGIGAKSENLECTHNSFWQAGKNKTFLL